MLLVVGKADRGEPKRGKAELPGSPKLPVGDDRVDVVLVAARWNARTASAADAPGADEHR